MANLSLKWRIVFWVDRFLRPFGLCVEVYQNFYESEDGAGWIRRQLRGHAYWRIRRQGDFA